MINIYNLRNFYQATLALIIKRIGAISREIIMSVSINSKIDAGLSLSSLWFIARHLQDRLKLMAIPPIIDGMVGVSINMPNTIEEVLKCCEAILSSKCILLEHERRTAHYIIDNLVNQKIGSLLDDCPTFPPGRDLKLKYSNKKTFHVSSNKELMENSKSYLSFLYYVLVDVEISAMEICAHQMLNNSSMPEEFKLDLAKQIWDEARHAKYIYGLFMKLGGDLSTEYYTNSVIDKYMKSSMLLESLIIQQLLQEGNAVEVNLSLIDELTKQGRYEEANAFININNDEAFHVQLGNKWVAYLAKINELDEEQLLNVMVAASEKIGIPLFGKGGWNSEIRERTGFPYWFIAVREQLFN
ncbi:ferritin-like domain-containing protein [Xenorhabdus sp. DI]|uniref:DUF455 family protein n=1 Tax=Xenorhabdus doucetiae TaxID=351671 RepID=UPI0019B2ABA7|nr:MULTISPECIES: DUF455 family protein [unclassified Xenorhabdus]MBD2785103.1 ferritin-like domain-containing protein [Xenorhabdus sp. 3]MBD2787566.1 ferritin-like domain-containing protein [Xenorhabdus sp. DI]